MFNSYNMCSKFTIRLLLIVTTLCSCKFLNHFSCKSTSPSNLHQFKLFKFNTIKDTQKDEWSNLSKLLFKHWQTGIKLDHPGECFITSELAMYHQSVKPTTWCDTHYNQCPMVTICVAKDQDVYMYSCKTNFHCWISFHLIFLLGRN